MIHAAPPTRLSGWEGGYLWLSGWELWPTAGREVAVAKPPMKPKKCPKCGKTSCRCKY